MPNTTRHKLTREKFLEEMLRGKGIARICREHGYKSTSIFYKWKTKYPDFKEQSEKILASPQHQARILASQSPKVAGDTWREQYINKLRESGSRTVAADYCGKSVTYILDAVNPAHEDFDEAFYDLVREQDLREAVSVEDELKRKAVVENSVQMQKWIIPFLPVVGEKYYRGAENRLKQDGNTFNIAFFQQDGIQGATKLLKEMFGGEEKEIVQ